MISLISLIFAVALYVLLGTMIYTLVQRYIFNADLEQVLVYFNMVEETSTAFRFTMYSVYASVVVWLLSFLVPPLFVVAIIVHTVVKVMAWWWLYESYKKGFVQTWIADFTESFKKK